MHKPTLLLLLLLAASVPGFARAGDVQEDVADRTDIDTEAADTGDSDVEVEVDDVDFRDADREIRDADGEGRAADGEVRADDGKDRTADGEVRATDGETADAEGEVRAADGEVKRVDGKDENADGEVKTADGRDRGGEAAVERDAAYASQAPVVRVHGGRIRGKVLTSSGGRRYFAYMGIPYAKPPEGDLRFKFPRRLPEKAWSGVRRCDQIPPKCPQLSYPERVYEGDEDCLYLNVYTHRTVDMSVSLEELLADMRPVLVWLHGGNFQHGSGTFDDVGPERFMDNTEDIVLVVPNYRLNALGFLSINEHPAVGNAGMKDIFKALSWLHGNIPQFGGHPGKTTLGGFEAGGAAAHLHALSPLSSVEPNLFEQTMSMSGTALAPWAVVSGNEARRRAIMLGRELSCVKKGVPDAEVDGPAMVRCLRTKSAESIVFACDAVLDWHGDISFPFVPSVENFDGHNRPFMIAHPEDVLREGGAALRGAKTWVSGITTHDGLPQALEMLVFKGLQRELSQRFEDVVWDYLGMRHMVDESPISLERLRALGRRLRDHYLPSKQGISLETLPGLIDLTSDALYAFSLYRSAQLHADADRAPALVYRFGFDRHKDRTRVLGVPLGADVDLMFPAVFANEKSNLTQEEIVVSKKLLKFLTNYIALQDPTPEEEDLLDKVAWPAVKNGNFSFIDINLQGKISIASDFYRDRMDLWVSVFEELKSEVPTNTERNSSDKANQTKDEL